MPKNDAIRNILEDALLPTDGTGEEPEAPAEEAVVTPDAQGEESEETPADEVGADESEAGDGTDEDVPSEYYGVDLSALSAEERAAIVAGFQERDKFIQQLLRNKADEPAEAPKAEDPGDAEASDADILQALGLDDPDDAYAEHTAKVALPLAKLVLSLQEEVSQVKARTELDATERYWQSSLDQLEAKHGGLPVSHAEVMKMAAEAGVGEPVDAYWRIMGPARQEVMAEVQKRRAVMERSLKQSAKGTVRPSTGADTTEAIIDAKDVKDATRQALSMLFRERGISVEE